MIHFEDTRTPAMKAADLEISEIREEREVRRSEFDREGQTHAAFLRSWGEGLEEKLSRLYRAHYELQGELGDDSMRPEQILVARQKQGEHLLDKALFEKALTAFTECPQLGFQKGLEAAVAAILPDLKP